MILYHIIILAVIQGLTEFLPISSSGHLGLYHCFTDHCEHWDTQNLTLDIAVHVGTLFSVILYFWKDVLKILRGVLNILCGNFKSENAKLALFLVISSIPVIIAGFIINAFEPDWLKTMYVIAWTTLIFGIILWWSDTKSPTNKEISDLTAKHALYIGLAQILALIPGTSRSGITMTMARFLGYNRRECARYSMLMSIIAISGAGTLIGLNLIESGNVQLGIDALIAAIFAFISGWIAIAVMMKFLQTQTFTVFAIYRAILGTTLLILLYSGTIG